MQVLAYTAPNIPGEDDWLPPAQGGGGAGVNEPNPSGFAPFVFNTGETRMTIQSILDVAGVAVQQYNAVKSMVDSDRGWLFQVKAPQYLSKGSSVSFQGSNGDTVSGDIMNQDLVAAEDMTLKGVADTITLVGHYMGWLNHTAQTYAKADINCVMPVPVPPVGPALGPVHDDPNPNDWNKNGG